MLNDLQSKIIRRPADSTAGSTHMKTDRMVSIPDTKLAIHYIHVRVLAPQQNKKPFSRALDRSKLRFRGRTPRTDHPLPHSKKNGRAISYAQACTNREDTLALPSAHSPHFGIASAAVGIGDTGPPAGDCTGCVVAAACCISNDSPAAKTEFEW